MVGLGDEMVRQQVGKNGELLPAYGFINDENYKKTQPRDAICILYGIKANGPLNSQIHGNAYSRLTGGKVRFLIKEQEAKNALANKYNAEEQGVGRIKIDSAILDDPSSVQSGIQKEATSLKTAREAFVAELEGTGEVGRQQ